MKKLILLIVLLSFNAIANPPPGYCDVIVCNKLERFSLSPWSHVKDKIGEQCFTTVLEKKDAVKGKVLDSSTRFYQGSFNPTKKSVTRVKAVVRCSAETKQPAGQE
jgi:hypothetical protein